MSRASVRAQRSDLHAAMPHVELATCSYIERADNVVFQGYAGTGKSYLSCALLKEACRHRIRAHYIRIPDMEALWRESREKPGGDRKFLRRYGNFTVLALDEWLLDKPSPDFRSFLLELMERRYGTGSTIFCTQHQQKDWHALLGGGVHAEAIMDRIVHNAIWIETGGCNMREKRSGR